MTALSMKLGAENTTQHNNRPKERPVIIKKKIEINNFPRTQLANQLRASLPIHVAQNSRFLSRVMVYMSEHVTGL